MLMFCVCFYSKNIFRRFIDKYLVKRDDIYEANLNVNDVESNFIVFLCDNCNSLSFIPEKAYEEPFYIIDIVVQDFFSKYLTDMSFLVNLVRFFVENKADVIVTNVLDPCIEVIPRFNYYHDVNMIFIRDILKIKDYFVKFKIIRVIFMEFLLRMHGLHRRILSLYDSIPIELLENHLINNILNSVLKALDEKFEKIVLRNLCNASCIMYVRRQKHRSEI